MTRDPYQVLGVSKQASDADIKQAFRAHAKSSHPDANRSDPKAQERFAAISNAYALLSDKEKRSAFDNGTIDAQGNQKMNSAFSDQGGFGDFAGHSAGFDHLFGGARKKARGDASDPMSAFGGSMFEDLFASATSQQRHRTHGSENPNPQNHQTMSMEISLREALKGSKKTITLPSGRKISVKTPKQVWEGQQIRVRGQRLPGRNSSPDVLITLEYALNHNFTVQRSNVHLSLPITLNEAINGGQIEVPTPEGSLNVTIPRHSRSGHKLRLKHRGMPQKSGLRGDMILTLMIDLPTDDPELARMAAQLNSIAGSNPRDELLRTTKNLL